MKPRAWIRALFGDRANAVPVAPGHAHPASALEAAYAQRIEALEVVRSAVASVLASEKRLEMERRRFALASGDPDGERTARLDRDIAALRKQREKLSRTAAALGEGLDEMRAQRMTLGVRLAASHATERATLAADGIAENAYETAARARALAEAAAPQERWLPDPDSGE